MRFVKGRQECLSLLLRSQSLNHWVSRPTLFQVDSSVSSLVTQSLGWRYQPPLNRRSIFLRP
jgi:hypothetical protein